jgi:hypothetical protein
VLHQVDGSERVGGGHVWPCLLDSLNGKHGLAHVVPTGRLGNSESLPDDVLKVRIHAGYESAGGGKRKAPQRDGASWKVIRIQRSLIEAQHHTIFTAPKKMPTGHGPAQIDHGSKYEDGLGGAYLAPSPCHG